MDNSSRAWWIQHLLILLVMVIAAIIIPPVFALPTTGAATAISSNNATIPVAGITGTDVWVVWGQNPGGEIWNTANYTPSGGAANVLIWGAPLFGDTKYYAKACDSTGCGNEITFVTVEITPMPTTTFGAGYKNATESHFNVMFIGEIIENVYSPDTGAYGIPRTLLYGLLISLVFLGLWMRTRSIRICSSLGLMLGVLLFSPNAGLMLGIPGTVQLLGGLLLAAGMAGWILALVLKK